MPLWPHTCLVAPNHYKCHISLLGFIVFDSVLYSHGFHPFQDARVDSGNWHKRIGWFPSPTVRSSLQTRFRRNGVKCLYQNQPLMPSSSEFWPWEVRYLQEYRCISYSQPTTVCHSDCTILNLPDLPVPSWTRKFVMVRSVRLHHYEQH